MLGLFKFGKKRKEKHEEKTAKVIPFPKKEKKVDFPCSSDNCLVRMACTKPCDKIEMDDEKVMKLWLKHERCPDCGGTSLMEGPSGGGATNVKCRTCGHWFNMGLPLFIQRIHMTKERFYE